MGKLIRMGVQERRLLRPKRRYWSRLLFLLGMLLISSSYQHLRSPWDLPSLWAAVSSQPPVERAGQRLSNAEMVMVSSDPPEVISQIEGEMLVPHATVSWHEETPWRAMENTPNSPRKKANASPAMPKKNNSPTAAGRGRVMENTPTTPGRAQNHYALTSSRQTIKNATPTTPRGETKSYSPTQVRKKVKKYTPSPPPARIVDNYASSTLMTMKTSHLTTPRKTAETEAIVVTYKTMDVKTPKRIIVKNTPTALKGIDENTPVFQADGVEMNILTSPRSTVENNTLTAAEKRVENNSLTKLRRLVGNNNLTNAQRTVLEQVVVSSSSTSSPAETKTSTAPWSFRNSSPRSSVPTISTRKRSSSEHSTSVTPRVRGKPTTQVRHCVVVEPVPVVPTSSSPILVTEPSLSPSTLPSSQPDLHPKGEYPPDLFTVQERREGWVVLHIFGMTYVFVALAIVCDEFFVPALGVITEKLQISEDVAGATFMAAGGSAPELFTSLIGVFISHSNVGIGTIVGSAVFNILFVIGTCSLFSREILHLTWWPLFRDVSFYILDLMMLILFFLDSLIAWWESLLLLLAYAFYVFTMKWNKQLEFWVKEQLGRRPMVKVMALGNLSKTVGGAVAEDQPQDNKKLKLPSLLTRGSSSASLHNSTIRNTIYQIMVHSLHPLGEAHHTKDKEEESLHQETRVKPQANAESRAEEEEPAELPAVTVMPCPAPDIKGDQEEDPDSQEGNVAEAKSRGEMADGELEAPREGATQLENEGETAAERKEVDREGGGEIHADDGEVKGDKGDPKNSGDEEGGDGDSEDDDEEEEEEEEEQEEEEEEGEEENEEPLSLEWPETRQKQAMYLFLLPIVLPLWLTVPDVRRLESRKFFVLTFLGAIIWIAIFSYLMVWWAHQVGETIGISEEIMGLTILAAGTSIPDLITSVIVARKGLGDMAVSSSVGSNIFDITVGLPVPWLLFSLVNGLLPVPVSSNGLFCAIVLLFLMLLFVIFSIASCKWKMNKILGFTMFVLYFAFLITSVLLEDRIISCPVSV
ncbi:sodium/potassium/calcium exchanger 1 [Rhynchocyon petersi]